jgi:hypothetical protein
MSALLSEADMRVAPAYVYFGPKADIPECLFNHLIGSIQYAKWQRDAQRFGGLEINNKLKLRGLLDGKVFWFGPLQDFIQHNCRPTKQIPVTRSGNTTSPSGRSVVANSKALSNSEGPFTSKDCSFKFKAAAAT